TTLRDRDGSVGGDFKYILRGKPPVLPGVIDAAAAAPIVGNIKVEGNLRFKESRIRRRLRVKKGKPRNRATLHDGLDRAIKFYHDRDSLMADLDYRETHVTNRMVDLSFNARAGPRVRIDIEGVHGKAGLRQEIMPFWEKGLFQEDIVEQARARIETVFEDR